MQEFYVDTTSVLYRSKKCIKEGVDVRDFQLDWGGLYFWFQRDGIFNASLNHGQKQSINKKQLKTLKFIVKGFKESKELSKLSKECC